MEGGHVWRQVFRVSRGFYRRRFIRFTVPNQAALRKRHQEWIAFRMQDVPLLPIQTKGTSVERDTIILTQVLASQCLSLKQPVQ